MASSTQIAREEKRRFFDDLERLGQSEEDTASEDEVRIIPNPFQSKALSNFEPSSRKSPTQSHGQRTRIRSPTIARKPLLKSVTTLPQTFESDKNVPMKPKEGTKLPEAQSKEVRAKTGRGRFKAKDEVQLVPEDQRIFNDLTFFFIPNNDVTKPRRKRIQAGIARGATWARTYSDAVTHVVVDIELDTEAAAKAFTNRQIPEAAKLVKDTWLIDSIKFGYLQNDAASRYRLKGAPATAQVEQALVSSIADNNGSPKTRKRKLQEMQQQETPTRASPPNIEDELDKAIREMKDNPHILLDTETDSVSSFDHSITESVPDEDNGNGIEQHPLQRPKENQGFQCMEKNDGQQSNPNARTIEILQGMASYYDRTGDQWRTYSYRKGITALRKQKNLIKTKEEACKIPGIGQRLADKIEEIVTTDRLRRLESAQSDPNDAVLQLFMGIYDVGYKQASKWIAQGHRTLSDLIHNVDDLAPNQKVGIEHYTDFQTRIPREEVAQHGAIVKRALLSIDLQLELIIGGSYRRGNTSSGDVDLLITKKNASMSHIRTLMTSSVIPLLQSQNFLKVALATGSSHDASKWHGASCLPDSTVWRRIDLLYVPWESLGAALIYFTGNDIFNRSIRLLASRKGWRLNQHGLFKDVMRGEGRKRVTDGTLIEGHSEKKIFEVLGVPWRMPCDRKC